MVCSFYFMVLFQFYNKHDSGCGWLLNNAINTDNTVRTGFPDATNPILLFSSVVPIVFIFVHCAFF